MSETKTLKFTAESAAEVCRRFELGEDAEELLGQDLSPEDFLGRLQDGGLWGDAVHFLAFALSKPDAVKWSCGCLSETEEEGLDEANREALNAARAWLDDPTPENCYAAGGAAEKLEHGTAAAQVAASVFWSGDSLAPPDLPPIPPADELAGQAVATALVLASVSGGGEDADEKLRLYVERGLALAPWGRALRFLAAVLAVGPRFSDKPAHDHGRQHGTNQLGNHESRDVGWLDAGEAISQAPRDGHRRICERGRGGEPVGRRDVEPDGIGHRLGTPAQTAEDRHDEAEGGDPFREPLGGPGAGMTRGLQHWHLEHQVGAPCSDHRADNLGAQVERGMGPADLATHQEG